MAWFGGFTLETYNRIPGEYEVVPVGGEPVGFSPQKITPESGAYVRMAARAALLTTEGGDLRFRIDGGTPTADNGHYLTSGDTLVLTGTQALQRFRALKAGETQVTLRVTYFY